MVRRLIVVFLFIAAELPAQIADLTAIAERTRPSVFLITTADRSGNQLLTGTGFLASKDGYLVTNHHVIRKAASAVAKGPNGTTFQVEGILGTDLQRDLSVLKIASRDTPALPMGASINMKPGERVAVIGSPLGLEGSLSEGIIAANRDLKNIGRMLQITAPISHGSSGSPVLDSQGRVVGIAVSSLKAGQAINFAIPVEELTRLTSKIRFGQAPTRFTDSSISPMDRPDDQPTAISASSLKGPQTVPSNLLSQIQLRVISNEKGALKFEVHNSTGWALRSVTVDMHKWSQHGPGTHSHAHRNVELAPSAGNGAKPYSTSTFAADVGDFLSEVMTDYGRGPVADPTYFETTVTEATGTGP